MNDEIYEAFVSETAELLKSITNGLLRLEAGDGEAAHDVFRAFHTIKGSCSIVGIDRGESFAHSVETRLEKIRNGSPAGRNVISRLFAARDLLERILWSDTIGTEEEPEVLASLDDALRETGPESAPSSPSAHKRDPEGIPRERPAAWEGSFVKVSDRKMRTLLSLASELVVAVSDFSGETEGTKDSRNMIAAITGRVYRAILDTNMIPAGEILERHCRTVSDIARSTGKRIRFAIEGGDVEIDKAVAEKLAEPLLHLVRNAADHGIETPDERAAAGKDPEGTVTARVRQECGFITLEISDDGAGLDPARIREKAVSMGLLAEGETAANSRLFDILFLPGFSMSSGVTKWSGRGVGLDAVKRSLSSLRGTAAFRSEPGRGSSVVLRFPVSLSLIEGFIATVNRFRILISYESVRTCFDIERASISWRGGENGAYGTAIKGGRLYPVVDLSALFPDDSPKKERPIAVVLDAGNGEFAVLVDEVGESANVMIRTINRKVLAVKGIAGFATLGDGSVVLVLDPSDLMDEGGALMPGAGKI